MNEASLARAWACALLDALDSTLAPPQSGQTTLPSDLQMLQLDFPRSRIDEAFQTSFDINSGKYELLLSSASVVVIGSGLRSFARALTHRDAGADGRAMPFRQRLGRLCWVDLHFKRMWVRARCGCLADWGHVLGQAALSLIRFVTIITYMQKCAAVVEAIYNCCANANVTAQAFSRLSTSGIRRYHTYAFHKTNGDEIGTSICCD